jgi:hypothetical protein
MDVTGSSHVGDFGSPLGFVVAEILEGGEEMFLFLNFLKKGEEGMGEKGRKEAGGREEGGNGRDGMKTLGRFRNSAGIRGCRNFGGGRRKFPVFTVP